MSDVIAANRLADGVVVFQTAENGWSEEFNRAVVRPDGEAIKAALARSATPAKPDDLLWTFVYRKPPAVR